MTNCAQNVGKQISPCSETTKSSDSNGLNAPNAKKSTILIDQAQFDVVDESGWKQLLMKYWRNRNE